MKVTAKELYELKIIDKVIAEAQPASKENLLGLCKFMRKNIRKFIYDNFEKSGEQLAKERYERFRNM